MPWMIPAAIIGSSLIGGAASSNAASSAADASRAASDAQLQMFNTSNAQQAPWRQAGENALGTIASMQPQFTHSFNAGDLQSNLAPNYQFQLEQGLGAVKNAGNAQTGLLSGNTLRGINDYAQNYAGNAYQQAFNNYNAQQTNIFNRLSTIAGFGSTANQTSAGLAGNLAGPLGNSLSNIGAAQAAGTMGVGNALSGGLSSLAGWYNAPQNLNTSVTPGSSWTSGYDLPMGG